MLSINNLFICKYYYCYISAGINICVSMYALYISYTDALSAL